MSVEHMPNPPDRPTRQATTSNIEAQTPVPDRQEGEEPQSFSLVADMARIIEENLDAVTQKQMYHSQMLLGVSALGTDPVTARTTAQSVAHALRNHAPEQLARALINLGDPQTSQVNDRTMPYRFDAQVAGLLEGIIFDLISKAYRDDSGRLEQARLLLLNLFEQANEVMQRRRSAPVPQAPAMSEKAPVLPNPELEPAT